MPAALSSEFQCIVLFAVIGPSLPLFSLPLCLCFFGSWVLNAAKLKKTSAWIRPCYSESNKGRGLGPMGALLASNRTIEHGCGLFNTPTKITPTPDVQKSGYLKHGKTEKENPVPPQRPRSRWVIDSPKGFSSLSLATMAKFPHDAGADARAKPGRHLVPSALHSSTDLRDGTDFANLAEVVFHPRAQ